MPDESLLFIAKDWSHLIKSGTSYLKVGPANYLAVTGSAITSSAFNAGAVLA